MEEVEREVRKGFLKTMEAVRPCCYFDGNTLVERKVSHARKRGSHPNEALELAKARGTWLSSGEADLGKEPAQLITTYRRANREGRCSKQLLFKSSRVYFCYLKDSDSPKQSTHNCELSEVFLETLAAMAHIKIKLFTSRKLELY